MNEKLMTILSAAHSRTGGRALTLDEKKGLLFQWLAAAQDDDLEPFMQIAHRRNAEDLSLDERDVVDRYRAMDETTRDAWLAAGEGTAEAIKAMKDLKGLSAASNAKFLFLGGVDKFSESLVSNNTTLYVNGVKAGGTS